MSPLFLFHVFMPEQEWTEERVRQLLLRAQPYSQNDSLLGSRIGLILRRLDPGFHPGVFGDSNLGALLARFSDVGDIVSRSPDLIFRYGSSPQSPLSAPFSTVADRPHLDRELWLAFVADRPDPARYLDLHTNKVIAVALTSSDQNAAVSPIDQETERYLHIPPIPQNEIRSVALEFIESHNCDSDAREKLRAHLDAEDWFKQFTDTASAVGVLKPWLDAHRAFVTSRAIAWLKKHNVMMNLFIKRQYERKNLPQRQLGSSNPLGLQRENLREVVIRAISRMPEEDLLNISIPLRYLVP